MKKKIACEITVLKSGKHVCDSFKVLCKEQKASTLVGIIKGLQPNEAQFIDNKCDWSHAKNWAQWWMRSNHLAMLTRIIPPWTMKHGRNALQPQTL